MAEQDNIKPRHGLSQVYVWPNAEEFSGEQEFANIMFEEFGIEAELLEQFNLPPPLRKSLFSRFKRKKEQRTVVIFAIRKEDVNVFDVKGKMRGIRSLGEVLFNHSAEYPPHLERYKTDL